MTDRFFDWIERHYVRATLITLLVMVLLTVLALGSVVHAADASLSWTHPTQREDGTALALTEIRETRIDWALCAPGNVFPAIAAGTKVVAAPATSGTVTGLTYGTWCFRARTVDTAGLPSANTGTVFRAYIAPPNPPTLLTVSTIAYELKTTGAGIMLGRNVGTVPLGVPCVDPALLTTAEASYYAVPLDQVTITKAPKGVVVAKCGEVQS